jgi:hypothetical protein
VKLNEGADAEKAKVRFALKVIYQQTLMTLDNNHLHIKLTDLAAPRHPMVVNRSDLVCAPRREGRGHNTKVVKTDCLDAAEDLLNIGFEHVAVLVMANQRVPGGGVEKGAGAQEEDMFRRTDVLRHVQQYQNGSGYPLDTTEPTAMVIGDVTICRGPSELGYPFLEIRPKVSLIFVAAKKDPAIIKDDENGICYGIDTQKEDMRLRVMVLCQAAMNCGCKAVVVSAFGCGAFKHPPNEVAKIFREEIKKAGGAMPLVFFAILDDHNTRKEHNPDGNFQPFYNVLHQTGWDQEVKIGVPHPQAVEKSKKNAGMEVDSVTITGDGKGSVAPIASGPGSHKAKESMAAGSDDPMGPTLPAAPVHYDDRSDIQAPFTSDASEAKGQAIGTASGSATENLTHMIGPKDTRHLVVFKPTTSAIDEQRKLDTEHVYIFECPAASCDDVTASMLLAMLMKKYAETAKWQLKWDTMNADQRIEVCLKGRQRKGGRKSSDAYNYLTDATPPFMPIDNAEIEHHCADFLEFATVRCKLPLDFWLTSTARSNRGITADPLPMHVQQGDCRISMALTITRAMHGKGWCSFIPWIDEPKRDTYYFPDGIAFTNEQKSSTIAAASVLFGNPAASLPASVSRKAIKWNMELGRLCDVQHPSGVKQGLAQMVKSTSSSSTAKAKPVAKPVAKKRPAAQKLSDMD